MFDIVKFIAGLQDYIAKAIAPIADQVRSVVEKTGAIDQRVQAQESVISGLSDAINKRIDGLPKPIGAEDVSAILEGKLAGLPDEKTILSIIEGAVAKPATKEEIQAWAKEAIVLVDPQNPLERTEVEEIAKAVAAPLMQSRAEENSRALQALIDALPAPVSADAIAQMVDDAVKALPAPAKGDKGQDGKSVAIEDVRPIIDQVVEVLQARFDAGMAKWQLDFERRATDAMAKAIEAIPKPKDGADGLDLSDFRVEQDGRKVSLYLEDKERTKEFVLSFPWVMDAGFYQPGKQYEKGDGVTFGGCFWIAQEDTDLQPGDNGSWRKAVNKGRDARVRISEPQPAKPVRLSGPSA